MIIFLGEVIHALASNASIKRKNTTRASASGKFEEPKLPELHVPYLNTKLTHFLKDSLGGTAKTIMLTGVGPESENYHGTLHALQYATKAMKIINYPAMNKVNIPIDFFVDPAAETSVIK